MRVAWHKSDCEFQLTCCENLGRHAAHLTTLPLPATTKERKWRQLHSGGHLKTGRDFLPGLLQKHTSKSSSQLRQPLMWAGAETGTCCHSSCIEEISRKLFASVAGSSGWTLRFFLPESKDYRSPFTLGKLFCCRNHQPVMLSDAASSSFDGLRIVAWIVTYERDESWSSFLGIAGQSDWRKGVVTSGWTAELSPCILMISSDSTFVWTCGPGKYIHLLFRTDCFSQEKSELCTDRKYEFND